MQSGFRSKIGLESKERSDGEATVVLHADESHTNPYGSVHGGAIATLVDSAMGEAVASAGADAPVKIEMKVTYLEPAQPGELTATAKVRKRGRRITIVEAEVHQEDELIALALATFTS